MRPKWQKSGELTGRRRFRKAFPYIGTGTWKLDCDPAYLVLQVEYTEFTNVAEGKPGRWVCMWRDATPDDVTEDVV